MPAGEGEGDDMYLGCMQLASLSEVQIILSAIVEPALAVRNVYSSTYEDKKRLCTIQTGEVSVQFSEARNHGWVPKTWCAQTRSFLIGCIRRFSLNLHNVLSRTLARF